MINLNLIFNWDQLLKEHLDDYVKKYKNQFFNNNFLTFSANGSSSTFYFHFLAISDKFELISERGLWYFLVGWRYVYFYFLISSLNGSIGNFDGVLSWQLSLILADG